MRDSEIIWPMACAALSLTCTIAVLAFGIKRGAYAVVGLILLSATTYVLVLEGDSVYPIIFYLVLLASLGSVVLAPAAVAGVLGGFYLRRRQWGAGVALASLAPLWLAYTYATTVDPRATVTLATRYLESEPRLLGLMGNQPYRALHSGTNVRSRDRIILQYALLPADQVGGDRLYVTVEARGLADEAQFQVLCVSRLSPSQRTEPGCQESRLALDDVPNR